MMINGVFCHETGCPNTHKVYDSETDTWVDEAVEDDEWEWEWESDEYEEDEEIE